MICALVLDLNHRQEFPVHKPVLGRALAAYPLIAAKSARAVKHIYLITDSKDVKAVALQYGTIIIDPLPDAAIESLVAHGYAQIRKELNGEHDPLEALALLFTHAATVTGALIDEGVSALREMPDADCALSVSSYPRWSPPSARRQTKEGWLEPYAAQALETKDEAWFPDHGVCVLRPRYLDSMAARPADFPWTGRKTVPIKQWGGTPIDHEWQVPNVEYWLKKHGVSDLSPTLERQPKPQPAPKGERR